jgi:hypothetical protein
VSLFLSADSTAIFAVFPQQAASFSSTASDLQFFHKVVLFFHKGDKTAQCSHPKVGNMRPKKHGDATVEPQKSMVK